MNVLADIAVIITAILVGVGFVFAYYQLKDARSTRMAQLILEISAQWDSKELKKSRQKIKANAERLKEAIKEAEANNKSEDLFDLVQVGNFFDTLGVLVAERYLSCRIAYDLLGKSAENYYKIYEPILKDVDFKDNYKYFIQLLKAFENEEAERCKIPQTPRHRGHRA